MRQDHFSTLASALWPAAQANAARTARLMMLAFGGTVALTVSAKVQVPFYPVPLYLQTLVVLVLGAAYGSRLSSATIALYLLEGALGLPVFAGTPEKGVGLAYMMGPTGGFLAGFLIAAAFVGFCAERGLDRSIAKMLAVMTIGHGLIFACGLGWLAMMIGWPTAYYAGAEPFLLATVLKTLLAGVLLPGLWMIAPTKQD